MTTISNINASYAPLSTSSTLAQPVPVNQNSLATQSPSATRGSVLVSMSVKPTGVNGPAPVSMTLLDAVDAYQRNSATVPSSITLKGSTSEIQQNMDVLTAMIGNNITISAIKLTDRGGHIDFDASTFTANNGSRNLSTSTNATAKVLKTISGAYTLNLGNVTVSDVTAGFTPPTGATIKMKVVDSAANVGAAMTTLANNKSKLSSVTLSDPSNPITMTVAQTATYRNVLGIFADYKLNISSASIKDYNSKLASNTKIATVSINDTAANLNANISLLQTLAAAGNLKQVSVSDGKNITLDEGAALADSALLSTKFINGKGGIQVVSVSGVHVNKINDIENQVATNSSIELSEQISDLSTAVSGDITKIANAIGANHIGRISFTDTNPATPTLTFVNNADYDNNKNVLKFVRGNYNLSIGSISATEAINFTSPNSNAALKFNINDTAAHLSTNFDALQTLAAAGKITKIQSSDLQGKMITLTADKVLKNKAVITALNNGGNPYSVEVTGAKASAIDTLTAALTYNSNSYLDKISFDDTAANLSANMSKILSLAATTRIGNIAASGGALNIQGSLLNDSNNNNKLVAGAANLFAANFTNSLQVNVQGVAASHAKEIADLIAKNDSINNNGTLAHETVSDTHINIQSNIKDLEATATLKDGQNNALATLTAITVRDGGNITVADINDFTADKDALDLINPNYKLTITKASVADAATVKGDAIVLANAALSFGISDTADNLHSSLDDLKTLVINNQVSSIDSSDGPHKYIKISADQIGSHSVVLDNLTTGLVEVTGASATQAAKFLASPDLSPKIGLVDIDLSTASDASDFVKNIADLNTAASNANGSLIGTINLGANTLTLDAGTAKNNTAILSKGDFSPSTSGFGGKGVALTVNNLQIADLSHASFKPIAANTNVTLTDNINDTGSAVSSALDTLQANKSSIGTVEVKNAGTVTVDSNAQYLKDLDIITGKLSGNFTFNARNITVANAATMVSNSLLPPGRLSFNIVDTAKNISDGMANLKSWNGLGELGQITTTDNTNKAITVDFGTYSVSDLKGVISKIQGQSSNQFSINVINATAPVASSIKGVIALANQNASISTVSLGDSGANIAANLANLQALASSHNLGTVDVNDGLLTLSSAQVTASAAFLKSTFTSSNGTAVPVSVTVTGVAAGDVKSAMLAVNSNAGLNTTEIDVSDTAANLKGKIASLEAAAAGGIVQKIAAKDGGTITLDETADNTGNGNSATYDATDSTSEVTTQYQHALAAMTGPYGITITGISSQNVAAAETNIKAAANGNPDYKFSVVDDQSVLATLDPNSSNGTDTYLETLQSYAANGHLASITLAANSDPLEVSVAQVQADRDALSVLDSAATLKIKDTAANIVDPTALADVNSLVANHGATKTKIELDTAAAPTLTVAQLKSLKTTVNSATGGDSFITQATGGFGYTVSDHIGAVLSLAGSDTTGATSLLGNSGATIKLLEDYSTNPPTLPVSQQADYTALYNLGMQDSTGATVPDPTKVNWVS